MMYFLDPDRGRRRRVIARDRIMSVRNRLGHAIEKGLRDAGNRTKGLAAGIRAGVRGATPAVDKTLIARVRSRIGRAVSHPRAIQISVEKGRVILRGHVLRQEMNNLINTVEETQGVRHVVNQVEAHDLGENFPALQGGREMTGETPWPPALRLIVGATGGGLAIYSIAKRDAIGLAGGIVGLGLIARATSNRDLKTLLLESSRKVVSIHKSICVEAPIDEVYEFWANYQNFPRFMRHVREVTPMDGGRSRWVVAGPAGTPVTWDAEMIGQVPNQMLAWRTLPGSLVSHAGIVRFETSGLTTYIDVWLSYHPLAGTLGHLVASLFGANPKHELDEDMVRLKGLLEHGRVRRVGLDQMEGVRRAEAEPEPGV
jgi:uncharacterized membrane protein